MSDTVFAIALLAAVVGLGLAPALLTSRTAISYRWTLAILLLAASLWFNWAVSGGPHPFHLLLLIPFWISWVVSVLWLLKERIDAR